MTIYEKYVKMKGSHPDFLFLFRVGDFYETYNDDALEIGNILGVTVTSRYYNDGNEKRHIAGFPKHMLAGFLIKLYKAGKKVALYDTDDNINLYKQMSNMIHNKNN